MLHKAVQGHYKVEVIELLLAKGADINAKDNQGNTPLQLAIASGDPDIVQLLKRYDTNK